MLTFLAIFYYIKKWKVTPGKWGKSNFFCKEKKSQKNILKTCPNFLYDLRSAACWGAQKSRKINTK